MSDLFTALAILDRAGMLTPSSTVEVIGCKVVATDGDTVRAVRWR